MTGVCVSFESAEVLVAEGEALEFTLALDKTCPHSLSVDVALMDGTAVGMFGGYHTSWEHREGMGMIKGVVRG